MTIIETPILRRVIASGHGNFQLFKNKLENIYQKKFDDPGNQDDFVREVFGLLLKKNPPPQDLWKSFGELLDEQSSIVDIQSFLRNHRNELIIGLKQCNLISKNNGSIDPWKLL